VNTKSEKTQQVPEALSGGDDNASHEGIAHVAFDHSTVSAPASSSFRGSLTHPTQPLCTLRVRRRRRLTQHSSIYARARVNVNLELSRSGKPCQERISSTGWARGSGQFAESAFDTLYVARNGG
jgi:hypothetical protein